jgi:hypothetical protein
MKKANFFFMGTSRKILRMKLSQMGRKHSSFNTQPSACEQFLAQGGIHGGHGWGISLRRAFLFTSGIAACGWGHHGSEDIKAEKSKLCPESARIYRI